jgi:hypothetical protein
MLVACNIRGLNKAGKAREIGSRLLQLKPALVVLIETRVKSTKAANIRTKMRL